MIYMMDDVHDTHLGVLKSTDLTSKTKKRILPQKQKQITLSLTPRPSLEKRHIKI